MDLSADNSITQLKNYKIDYHSDGIVQLLIGGEVIYFSFQNDSVKVYISDTRIIIEENTGRLQYSFIGLDTVNYFQFETDELIRHMPGVWIIFGLKGNQKLELSIEDEIELGKLQFLLASNLLYGRSGN